MDQVIEFAGNHLFLVLSFFAVLGFIVYTEYQRLSTGAKAVSPYEVVGMQNAEDGAVVIDVREPKEFALGHVLNALNLPSTMVDKRIGEFTKYKSKPVVLYCDSGMRANRVGARLRKEGFEQLFLLTGGLQTWEKANLPVASKT